MEKPEAALAPNVESPVLAYRIGVSGVCLIS